MSMLGDYHGTKTRSRAMSLHQTSVYAGTIGGSAFASHEYTTTPAVAARPASRRTRQCAITGTMHHIRFEREGLLVGES